MSRKSKDADRAYQRAWYQQNKERLILKAIERNKKIDKKRRSEIQRKYYRKKLTECPDYFREKAKIDYHKNPEHYRNLSKKHRDKLRAEMIVAYGGKCNCCGENEPVFLTVEHKQRNGKSHRNTVGDTSTAIYRDLKKRGWPKDDYELLCFNCNRGAWALGACPHRLKGEDDDG